MAFDNEADLRQYADDPRLLDLLSSAYGLEDEKLALLEQMAAANDLRDVPQSRSALGGLLNGLNTGFQNASKLAAAGKARRRLPEIREQLGEINRRAMGAHVAPYKTQPQSMDPVPPAPPLPWETPGWQGP